MKVPLIAKGELVGLLNHDRPPPTFRQLVAPTRRGRRRETRLFSLRTYRLIENGIDGHYHIYTLGGETKEDEAVVLDLIARKEIEPYYIRPESGGELREALDSANRAGCAVLLTESPR